MSQAKVSWEQLSIPMPQPMDRGCPPGSIWFTFPATPVIGVPFRGTPSTPTIPLTPMRPGPFTPRQFRLRNAFCRPLVDAFTPPGVDPEYGHALLDQIPRMIGRWQGDLQPFVPGALDGPAQLNPANGNLVLRLSQPAAGAFAPATLLVYNSQEP